MEFLLGIKIQYTKDVPGGKALLEAKNQHSRGAKGTCSNPSCPIFIGPRVLH